MWLRFWVATTWHKPFTVALGFVEKTWKPFSQFFHRTNSEIHDAVETLLPIAKCLMLACPNSRMIGPVEDTKEVDASEMQQQKLEDFPRFHWTPTNLRTGFKDLSYQQPWIAGFWSLGCHGVTFPAKPGNQQTHCSEPLIALIFALPWIFKRMVWKILRISWSHQSYRDRLSWHRSTGDAMVAQG